MCGRFTYLAYEELVDVVKAVEQHRSAKLRPSDERAHARPGSGVHALVPGESRLEISPFTWGFESPDRKRLVFNTRIESALGGTTLWAEPIRNGRCITAVASFYEPHRTETVRNPRTGRLTKRQFEFTSPLGEPLLLASVHERDRLSIVTTEPNAHVSPIHARMPLILRFEEVPAWLAGNFTALADRSHVELAAQPEGSIAASEIAGSQMTLF